MKVSALRTDRVDTKADLLAFLDRSVDGLRERSILAITSKIVSICQGRVVPIGTVTKKALIRREAEYLLPYEGRYGIVLTIKEGLLIPMAGIDESNGDGFYVLWPERPQRTANRVRQYLTKRFRVKEAGVIITDSKTTPLRRGTIGVAVAYSGFAALNNYVGRPDLFGRTMQVTRANVLDGLAAAAVVAMGEGDEQTPLAVLEHLPFVRFRRRNPSKRELAELRIPLKEDLYAPILERVKWTRGLGRRTDTTTV